MKPPGMLARSCVRDLTRCAHGGDVWEAAERYGLSPGEILDFSSNVNPLGPSPKALKAIIGSLWQIPLYSDPDSGELRRAISHHFGGLSPLNVIVGNGATELIYLIGEAFIEEGDEAVIFEPTFGEYEVAVRRAGGVTRNLILGPDFAFEPSSLSNWLGPRTKIVFICNPNNPTGTLTPKEKLLEAVGEASEKGAIVVVDECFMDLADGGEDSSLAREVRAHQNLVVLRSFTKAFGLTGIRVGYGLASEEIIEILSKAKVTWNVNCLAQAAAVASLRDDRYLERTKGLVRRERAFLLRRLAGLGGIKVYPSAANFILMDVRRTGLTAPRLKEELLKRSAILIRDCSSFKGLDGYHVRVAVRTRRENERLLRALKEVLNSSTPNGP